tara:strand:+ start:695 stop:883 length:189 start_codon:yes stop_codon:yes gene_type:complete
MLMMTMMITRTGSLTMEMKQGRAQLYDSMMMLWCAAWMAPCDSLIELPFGDVHPYPFGVAQI